MYEPSLSKGHSGRSATGEAPSVLRTCRYCIRAVVLAWQTDRWLTLALAALTAATGVLPAVTAYVGALIVDAVVAAIGHPDRVRPVLELLALEVAAVGALNAAQRGLSLCQSLLRARLAHQVNTMILRKALDFELPDFENAELYDLLLRAKTGSTSRPMALLTRSASLLQAIVSLVSFAYLLVAWSPWAVVVLLVAGLPGFVSETRFSGHAFRLFLRRAPETRMQTYLETVISRDDHVKEVKFFDLGSRFLDRHSAIFERLYPEDCALTIRRHGWALAFDVVATAVYYGAYVWVVLAAVARTITLGQMTMYLQLFRQGQGLVSAALSTLGGLYEDSLYWSTFYALMEANLDRPIAGSTTCGPDEGDGLRLEHVSFTYPRSHTPAVNDVSLHLPPGKSLALIGENGCGKTTLIKLITRLYRPTAGRILLDGLDLNEWDEQALRARMSVVFQDFNRYQTIVGENIGAGDDRYFDEERRWREAARLGRADALIDKLPNGYQTQLGHWFSEGQSLSGGEWQRVAASRAFMRRDADLFILDEATAMLDVKGEAEIFDTIRRRGPGTAAILISHRLAVARIVDEIVVLAHGRVVERGTHESLMAGRGRYAALVDCEMTSDRDVDRGVPWGTGVTH